MLFNSWLLLEVLQVLESGLAYLGWAILLGFFAYGAGLRANIREKYAIPGNMCEDFFAVMLLYPLASVQMEEHVKIAWLAEGGHEETEAIALKVSSAVDLVPEVLVETEASTEARNLMEQH